MSFVLGRHSKTQLVGLYPDLGFLFTEGIKITKQDFILFDGVRTDAQQRALYDRGVTKTLKSYHLRGLAGDAVPWVNGRPSWEEKYFPPLIKALKEVIKAHGLDIENGFDLWKWDMAHWQMLPVYRGRWDIRKISHELGCS